MWEKFIDNCRKHYAVGAFVTIDEQLIPFRDRCGFRQYMPSKPDKYGMNLFLLCDCLTGHTFSGMPMPYVRRQGNQRNVGLSADVVKHLSQPLHFTGVNITTDNWFTSYQLATDLLQKHITLLGTMRKNRREIPTDFVTMVREEELDSAILVSVIGKRWYLTYLERIKPWFYFQLCTMTTKLMKKLVCLIRYWTTMLLKPLLTDLINSATITVCKKEQSAGHLHTSKIALTSQGSTAW